MGFSAIFLLIGIFMGVGGALIIASHRTVGQRMNDAKLGASVNPSLLSIGTGITEMLCGGFLAMVGIVNPMAQMDLTDTVFDFPVIAIPPLLLIIFASFSAGIVGLSEEGVSIRALLRRRENGAGTVQLPTSWRDSFRPGGGLFMVINGVGVSISVLWLSFMMVIVLQLVDS